MLSLGILELTELFASLNVLTMEVNLTNKCAKCLMCDGFRYRVDKVLKSKEISWRCTAWHQLPVDRAHPI